MKMGQKQKINIPDSWTSITTDQYFQLLELEEEEDLDYIDLKLIQLSILTEKEDGFYDNIPFSKTEKLFKDFKFLNNLPNSDLPDFITLKKQKLYFRGFDYLSTGEFIDAENAVLNLKDKHKNLLCIFYRKKEVFDNDFSIEKFEKYDTAILERQKYIDQDKINADFLLSIVSKFTEYRNELFDVYSEYFEQEINEDYSAQEEDLTFKEKKELEIAKNDYEKRKRWAWESILFNLADGDIIKMMKLLELPIVYVLNMMSFKAENQAD